MYLRVYLAGNLIDEVSLNYNGLQNEEEKEWYHLGAVQHFYEKYEVILNSRAYSHQADLRSCTLEFQVTE
jgi:hypothetical protein